MGILHRTSLKDIFHRRSMQYIFQRTAFLKIVTIGGRNMLQAMLFIIHVFISLYMHMLVVFIVMEHQCTITNQLFFFTLNIYLSVQLFFFFRLLA
jgi:hypothetical protein